MNLGSNPVMAPGSHGGLGWAPGILGGLPVRAGSRLGRLPDRAGSRLGRAPVASMSFTL